MTYKLTEKDIDEARKHLEKAEDIFRKQSLLLASIINHAHYEVIGILKEVPDC